MSGDLDDPGSCGGTHIATAYFLLEPTETNPKNNFPASKAFVAHADGATYHLQNVALLPWYIGTSEDVGRTYSFPDPHALTAPAKPCTPLSVVSPPPKKPTVATAPLSGSPNGHQLIGYWTGTSPLCEVSPQWDVILVAFAEPARNAPEGTMQFHLRAGLDPEQFKSDIAYLKSQGKKVMISLGGGGRYFTLNDLASIPTFVSSVTQIVTEYGFDGIDLDFETPPHSTSIPETRTSSIPPRPPS